MLPDDKVVNAGKAFEDNLITIEDVMNHSHGEGAAHSHAGIDGHTWLDPIIAISQCETIANVLKEKIPAHKEFFNKNVKQIVSKLQSIDKKLTELSKAKNGKLVLASHPAYNYIARRYGWEIKSFDLDPEAKPEADAILAFRNFLAEDRECKYMLWESKPSKEVEEFFKKEFHIESVVFSPVETPPEKGDYIEVMEQNLTNIARIFE